MVRGFMRKSLMPRANAFSGEIETRAAHNDLIVAYIRVAVFCPVKYCIPVIHYKVDAAQTRATVIGNFHKAQLRVIQLQHRIPVL